MRRILPKWLTTDGGTSPLHGHRVEFLGPDCPGSASRASTWQKASAGFHISPQWETKHDDFSSYTFVVQQGTFRHVG